MATVFLAAPTSTDERLKRIAQASTGFVYAVSRTGVTGTRDQVASDASALVKRLRKYTKLPIAVGFGVSNRSQFEEVGKFADAVVIGSAIEQNPGSEAEAVSIFISGLRTRASVVG
jgi:tryptophan synthase alpha chain